MLLSNLKKFEVGATLAAISFVSANEKPLIILQAFFNKVTLIKGTVLPVS